MEDLHERHEMSAWNGGFFFFFFICVWRRLVS